MKRFSVLLVTSIFILIIISAVGCGNDTATNENGSAEEVVIGYTGPLSGPGAQYGEDVLSGVQMGIDTINDDGGITIDGQQYKFRLEKLDDAIDPTQAVNNAQRFVDMYDAPAVFNPVSNTITPLMEINEQEGSEFLTMAYTSSPQIDQQDNDLTVTIPPVFPAYVKGLSEIAWDEGWRDVAMVVTQGEYGDEWRETFEEHWEHEMGGEITADQPVNYYTETDFSSQLTAALDTDPDALLIGGPSEPTGLVIEQARDLGFEGGFILIDQAKMDYIADEVFDGSLDLMENVCGTGSVGDIPNDYAPVFNEEYREKFDRHNTWEAVLSYCSMHILAQAMEEAGTVDDVYAIREAFSEVATLSGDEYPEEYFGIHESGRLLPGAATQIIKNGEYQEPTTLIWWTDSKEELKRVRDFRTADNPTKLMPVEYYTD